MLASCLSSWWLVGCWNAWPNFNWNCNSTPLIWFHYKSHFKVLIFFSSIVINIINIQMWILCNLCTRKPIPALSLSSTNLLIIFSLWVEFKIYFHGHWWHIKTLFFNPLFSLLLHHPVVTDHLLLLSVMYLVMRFWPWLLCGWGGFILMFAWTHFFTSSSKVESTSLYFEFCILVMHTYTCVTKYKNMNAMKWKYVQWYIKTAMSCM